MKTVEIFFFKTLNFKHKNWRRIFGIPQDKLQLEYLGEMDGVIDFSLNNIIVNADKSGEDWIRNEELGKKIKKHFSGYPDDFFLVTFLDNHDMNRFLFHCNGDTTILLQAFELLLSMNQPVVIYYDTENGVYNKNPVTINQNNSDLYVREPFDWKNINYDLYHKFRGLFEKRNHGLPKR